MTNEDKEIQVRWPLAPAHDFKKTESLRGNASTRLVKHLIENMLVNGWQGGPIDVVEINSEKYIIDGHHRVFAARMAKIAVPYRIIPSDLATTDRVIIANAEAGTHRIRLR